MVPVSSLRVESSQFAEGGFYSHQQQYLGFIRPDQVEELLFDFCPDCHKQMSSIPQGAYATWKVRANEGKNQVPNVDNMLSTKRREPEKNTPHQPYYPHVYKKYQEQPPVKYNSKLMNSIWGLYNRYSVHNLKKITEGEEALQGVQQFRTAATPTSSSSGSKGGSFHNGPHCHSA
ncbi:uncharacterized protein LOC111869045 isoform X2 [Cryptotermes secundus]|uniref:uncharacterized protein LOC111869045 isoform X1 n=1 Tax=Cryptotermes secundus TaxID=105785 RepID=UPI000CD7CAA8|nr:uncharacterized protein LOC111869045 isoform X1 [Cryptotermes secundus]XP_023716008.1 uncharacterized protein LOC111869045 isoform X2 [Cryptotermes secundus]